MESLAWLRVCLCQGWSEKNKCLSGQETAEYQKKKKEIYHLYKKENIWVTKKNMI